MLSTIERILFIFLATVCTAAAYNTFKLMADIILQGQGKLAIDQLPKRLMTGAMALFSQGRILRHRKLSSILHWFVAWGFLFFFLDFLGFLIFLDF